MDRHRSTTIRAWRSVPVAQFKTFDPGSQDRLAAATAWAGRKSGAKMAALPACDVRRFGAIAERVSDAEHDDFGDDHALDEQEGAIGAEDAQRAFNLAPPVERQYAGDSFDELEVLVRGCREEGGGSPHGYRQQIERLGNAVDHCACDPSQKPLPLPVRRPALARGLSPPSATVLRTTLGFHHPQHVGSAGLQEAPHEHCG